MIIGLVGLAFVVVGGRGAAGKGRVGGLGAVIDQSIGMHIVRSLTRQTLETPEEDIAPSVALTADDVAYRIGIPGADAPVRRADAGRGRGAAATAAAVAANAGTASAPAGGDPAAAAAPRRRLIRDAGAALVGLSALALVVLVAQQVNGPHDGEVRGITHYRGSSDPPGSNGDTATPSIGSGQAVEGASAPPGAVSASAAPGAPGPGRLTLHGTTTPKPPGRSNGTPTTTVGPATPTPRITARPSTTPGPTATPVSTATPTPTAAPTPEPTPKPTPEPTPEPTPTPAGEPSPTP